MSKLDKFRILSCAAIGVVRIYALDKYLPRGIDYYKCYQTKKYISIEKYDNDIIISLNSNLIPNQYQHWQFDALKSIIERIDTDNTINIVLTTNGGNLDKTMTLCQTLKKFHTRVFVPWYAFSAGTVIALSANELYMSPYAELSAINPIFTFNSHFQIKYDNGQIKVIDFESKYRSIIESYEKRLYNDYPKILNTDYNIDQILLVMFTTVTCHSTYFTYQQLRYLTNHKVKSYDGTHINIIQSSKKHNKILTNH